MTISFKTLDISSETIADLAVEHWRLIKWVESKKVDDPLVVLKHVLRKQEKFFSDLGITLVDLTGTPFDPGLAAEVIEVIDDDSMKTGESQISETISPLVMLQGSAIKHAQVVIRKRQNFEEDSK
ncbi:hypothetical protein KA183_07260 [bacterium]|nr:hypothetical protein [bacterium]